jgi:hypothetical protein
LPDRYWGIVTKRPRFHLTALVALAAFLLTAPPAGAIDVPQTRQEFVRAVTEGARGAKKETLVVERDFDEVYKTLASLTTPCLDKEVKRSAYVGYWENSSSDYNPTLEKLGPDRAELTLQVVHRPRGVGHTPPPGGLYIMAADLVRAGPSRTEVVLYRPTIGFKDIAKTFVAWTEGDDTDCPKLK